MKAMILAAGLGTRLKPFTDHHPKALAVVNNKTVLHRTVEYLVSFGVTDIIINIHHFADQVIAHVNEKNNFGIRVSISDERDELLETGGGLKKAAWFFDDGKPFILMNADILTNADLGDMIARHQHSNPLATLAVSSRESSRCFLFNEKMELCGWRNNKTAEEKISRNEEPLTPFSFSGIHMISPAIFPLIKQEGKFSMVDVYLDLAGKNEILAWDHSGYVLMDVGKPESLEKASTIFT